MLLNVGTSDVYKNVILKLIVYNLFCLNFEQTIREFV